MTKPIVQIPPHLNSLGAELHSLPEIIAVIKKGFDERSLNAQSTALEARQYVESPAQKRFHDGKLVFDPKDDFAGFKITKENAPEIVRISDNIIEILRNPAAVFHFLKPLDAALGDRMRENGIDAAYLQNDPQYYLLGPGFLIPGPYPEGYRAQKKHRALHEELLKREQEVGVNLDGVAIFAGPVDKKLANEFVGQGNTFSEDEQITKLLLHGKYAHRLAFEVIRQAVKSGALNLNVEGYGQLSERQLLQILTSTYFKRPAAPRDSSLWERTLDNIDDSMSLVKEKMEMVDLDDLERMEKFRNLRCNFETTSFSARSPFVFTSLMTCFGREEVPNLCGYLLDNHYKKTAQMVKRIRDRDSENLLTQVPDGFIATYCMVMLSTGRSSPANVSEGYPFLVEPSHTRQVTEAFPNQSEQSNIRRKITFPEVREYSGAMEGYAEYKAAKYSEKQQFVAAQKAASAAAACAEDSPSGGAERASGRSLLQRFLCCFK